MIRRLFSALLLASSFSIAQQPATPPAGHDAHAVDIPGLKKELFAGITEADFHSSGTSIMMVQFHYR